MSKRSGTETRQRRHQVAVRLTDDEAATLTAAATDAGVTLPELLRRSALAPRTAIAPAPRSWGRGAGGTDPNETERGEHR